MGTIGEMTLEEAASQAAGNWKRYSCFCWDRMREIDDPDDWAIIYTHHRDSGLLDQSSGSSISRNRSQQKREYRFQLPAAWLAASSRVISPIVPMCYLRCESLG